MIKNHFKIAWRNLIRNKGFSVINLLGLTIGITCTLFIFLWVWDEMTFDKFNPNYNSIYEVMANRDFKNNIFTDENMVFPLAGALQNTNPQIKGAVVTSQLQPHIFDYGLNKFSKQGIYVSGPYFNLFPWKFTQGNALTALADPSSIVITESFAKILSGNLKPIGRVIKIDNNRLMKVTAVVADPPGNSTQQLDFIAVYNFSEPSIKKAMTEWGGSEWRTYIKTTDKPNVAQLENYITHVMFSHNHDKISSYFIFPMNKWHLYSDFKDGKNVGGMIEYVRLFIIIALIILLTACVNFVNLSTARSEKRAKEVGIRKTLGSGRKQLMAQFFSESMILVLIAFVFSMVFVFLLLPSFNLLVGKQLYLKPREPYFWIGAASIIIFAGIAAGCYPALYLSSFNPVKVLKGIAIAGKKGIAPRSVLVVIQFVGAILLISATIIVYKQIQHVKDRNKGYDPSNLIMVTSSASTDKHFTALKHDLLSAGLISSVTRTSSPVTEIWSYLGPPDWAGKSADASTVFSRITVDVDFVKTLGIKLLEGNDFTGMPSDSSSVLLNKAAVNAMHLKDPVGTQLNYGPHKFTIIGVADNVIMSSPYAPVEPLIINADHKSSIYINVRLNKGVQPEKAIALFKSEYKRYSPETLFEYRFIDQEFGKKFATEELIGKLTDIFAGLAVFLCCIGLAGLASFTIEQRTREIGIRKVLGATVRQLLMLISTEFLKLVLIAFVIAVPISWWLMNNWLQKYAYRIDISAWLFAIVGTMILLLTLIVVSLNTIGAAVTNPVKSLRSE